MKPHWMHSTIDEILEHLAPGTRDPKKVRKPHRDTNGHKCKQERKAARAARKRNR
jgi:hypothetical protein